jgi:hypothetical protein
VAAAAVSVMNDDDDVAMKLTFRLYSSSRAPVKNTHSWSDETAGGRTKRCRGASMADMKPACLLFFSAVLMTSGLSATPVSSARQAGRSVQAPSATPKQAIDLAALLGTAKLRVVNRDVTKLAGSANAVHVSERADNDVAWIQGSDFGQGTIEVDVRGRDVLQRSFLGIAFHGTSDTAYECVYVRPFNFRAKEPDRHQHAVQYLMLPDYDWPRLRNEFPEEFENPVDASVSPTDWVPLRIVVKGQTVQVFVGPSTTPALEARKLGQLDRGMIGLWTGNNSDGDFSNLRVTPTK